LLSRANLQNTDVYFDLKMDNYYFMKSDLQTCAVFGVFYRTSPPFIPLLSALAFDLTNIGIKYAELIVKALIKNLPANCA
jgi:hypothetical protein